MPIKNLFEAMKGISRLHHFEVRLYRSLRQAKSFLFFFTDSDQHIKVTAYRPTEIN